MGSYIQYYLHTNILVNMSAMLQLRWYKNSVRTDEVKMLLQGLTLNSQCCLHSATACGTEKAYHTTTSPPQNHCSLMNQKTLSAWHVHVRGSSVSISTLPPTTLIGHVLIYQQFISSTAAVIYIKQEIRTKYSLEQCFALSCTIPGTRKLHSFVPS